MTDLLRYYSWICAPKDGWLGNVHELWHIEDVVAERGDAGE